MIGIYYKVLAHEIIEAEISNDLQVRDLGKSVVQFKGIKFRGQLVYTIVGGEAEEQGHGGQRNIGGPDQQSGRCSSNLLLLCPFVFKPQSLWGGSSALLNPPIQVLVSSLIATSLQTHPEIPIFSSLGSP